MATVPAVARARDLYDLHVEERPPRRRRLRYLAALVAGAASDGALAPEAVVYDVRLIRRGDEAVVLEQRGVHADVVALLRADWEALPADELDRRWLRPDGP